MGGAESPVGMVQRAIRNTTDAAAGFAVRRFLTTRLAEVGEVTGATIDTAQQRATLQMALRGEADAVTIEIGHYRLEETARRAWITVTEASASRPWAAAALDAFVVGRRFYVPKQTATILRLVA